MMKNILYTCICIQFLFSGFALAIQIVEKNQANNQANIQSNIQVGNYFVHSYFPDEENNNSNEQKKNLSQDEDVSLSQFYLLNMNQFNPSSNNQEKTEPFLGLPMRYPTFPDPRAEKQTAMAVISRGQPIVVYGPEAAKKWGNNVMGIVLQHEYCHHDLQHIMSPPPMRNGEAAIREAQADCCSAFNSLEKYNQSGPLQEVIAVHKKKGCKYDAKTPLYQVSENHPCGTQRAYIIAYCAENKKYQLADDFISSPLPIE